MNFEELKQAMKELNEQIDKILDISGYDEYDSLEQYLEYTENTPDTRQLLKEYGEIIYKLQDIQTLLNYLEKPYHIYTIKENESGRFEAANGYYYTCGSGIEFHTTDENGIGTWNISRVEAKNGRYYIVGFEDVEMEGLTVKIRELQ